VALVPACAPYVVHVDALSKGFAGTGLRVGWAVMPPYLASRMAALIGHVGAWAPRAEQVAAAAFLQDVPAVEAYLTDFRAAVNARLDRFHDGIQALVAEGLPVNSIAPQGAIYLSFRVDLIGQPFATNEEIRRWLLDEAGIAVVPFQAFDLMEESGWFRLSVGAVGLAEIDAALLRLQALLRRHLAARLPAATRGLPPSSPPQEP
jgi:aspartate aminotransferase